ncbi:RHS repeat-associated core domain-containing protein [Paludibaculum fermentans]|uniref:RHS repeat-associated core domain-containing protein n=1 Tax=Paludibaculum fermentans TaxID=1473598 RepID=UPI003EC0D1E3
MYPYGEVSAAPSVDQDETFTTYKRNVYTGLDYAENRYYASAWGRFTTADPYRASGGAADPQSWNRYAYVENDPVNFNDPVGLQRWMITYHWTACAWYGISNTLACNQFDTYSFFGDGDGGGGVGGGGGGQHEWGGGGGSSTVGVEGPPSSKEETHEECEKRIRKEQSETFEKYEVVIDKAVLSLSKTLAIVVGVAGGLGGGLSGGLWGAVAGGAAGAVVGFITPYGGWGEIAKASAYVALEVEASKKIGKECPK